MRKVKIRGKKAGTNVAKKFRKNISPLSDRNISKPIKRISIPTDAPIGVKEFELFQRASNRGDYDEGISHLENLIEIYPDWGDGWVNLGWSYREKGDWDQALYYFNEAEQRGFLLPELYLNRAHVYSELQNFEGAEQDLKTLLKKYPNDPDARINLATLFFTTGRYPEALKTCQEHLKFFPDDDEALEKYYAMCLEADSLAEMTRIFPFVMEYNNKHISFTRRFLSQLSQRQPTKQIDQILEALRSYAQKSHLPQEEVLILVELGMNAVYRAEFEQAEKILNEAEQIAEKEMCQRELGYILNAKGSMYDLLQRFDDAATQYDKARQIAYAIQDLDLITYVLNNIGNLMKEANAWDDAEQLYLDLIQTCKKINDEAGLMYAYNHLADIYWRQQNFEDAKKFGEMGLILAKKRSNVGEITRSSIILARVDANNLDIDAAKTRLDYAESLVLGLQNDLDSFHFFIFRAEFHFEFKDLENAKITIAKAIYLLEEWIENNPHPDKYNLNELNQVLGDQLANIQSILNDSDLPPEEKSEMAFVIKRACEIVQNNPEKLDDPKIASKLPAVMRATFQQNQELKNQVSDLTIIVAELERQIEELRNKPRTLEERTESEEFWKLILGEDTWDWLDSNNREELLFSHICMAEAKVNARFYRVSMRSMALVVEDQFNTKFYPILMQRADLIPDPDTVGKKVRRTIGEIKKSATTGESISLGTLPFLMRPIFNDKNLLHNTPLFQSLGELWKENFTQLQEIALLLQKQVGNEPNARSYVKYRNFDAHTTRLTCSEYLVESYQTSTLEILQRMKDIFG